MTAARRWIAAVIGSARATLEEEATAAALGDLAVGRGFRIATGGLGGVMRAASRGARLSRSHQSGDVIGILPTYDASQANEFVEVPICTGLNHARNLVLVATADVVFVIGGRSGTLSEMALAWQLGKPVIAVGVAQGWGTLLAGTALDDRREDIVHGPCDPTRAIELAHELLSLPRPAPKGFG